MIHITGDTHGEVGRFMLNNMGDSCWGADDYLIVCGDFGFIFSADANEETTLDMLAQKPYHILFVDGNHENFDKIYSYPVEKWKGGYVHRIRKNIRHLMRGQVFKIEGKTFFTFGGAYSVDREWRREGISWWPQELPTLDEYIEGEYNLSRHGYKVDYILTHTAPQLMIDKLIELQPWNIKFSFERDYHDGDLVRYLGGIEFKTEYKHWYFGHWHFDTAIDEKSTAVLSKVHTI